VLGVHCGIYKSSYNISNISYLNSTSPPLSFDSLSNSWNSFNRYHFPFTYVCTQYLHYSHLTSPHTGFNPIFLAGPVLLFCSLILKKKKNYIAILINIVFKRRGTKYNFKMLRIRCLKYMIMG
jgi:hypothetical protein